jgi:hypothetical protein
MRAKVDESVTEDERRGAGVNVSRYHSREAALVRVTDLRLVSMRSPKRVTREKFE